MICATHSGLIWGITTRNCVCLLFSPCAAATRVQLVCMVSHTQRLGSSAQGSFTESGVGPQFCLVATYKHQPCTCLCICAQHALLRKGKERKRKEKKRKEKKRKEKKRKEKKRKEQKRKEKKRKEKKRKEKKRKEKKRKENAVKRDWREAHGWPELPFGLSTLHQNSALQTGFVCTLWKLAIAFGMAKHLQQQSSAELLTDQSIVFPRILNSSLRCSDSECGLLLGEYKSHTLYLRWMYTLMWMLRWTWIQWCTCQWMYITECE